MRNTGALAKSSTACHKGMTSREIKAELILRGISVSEIATAAGVTTSAVSQIINQCPSSRYKGYRIRKYIAQALNRSIQSVWPE